MRKQSLAIPLTILLGVASGACDEEETNLKHCVDENNTVVDEDKCADAGAETVVIDDAGNRVVHHGSSGFLWYYGGSRSPLSPGSRVSGGGYTPSKGSSYSSPRGGSISSPGISKGGFGGTGGGSGGEGAGG